MNLESRFSDIRKVIDYLKENISISEVIIHDLDLTEASMDRQGSNITILCPFHEENNPSFKINDNLGLFKCFGCGVGGDIIKWRTLYYGESLTEAILRLAEYYDLSLDDYIVEEDIDPQIATYLSITKDAIFYMHNNLLHSKSKLQLLYDRGLRSDTIEAFKIGFCANPDALASYLVQEGYRYDDIVRLGFASNMRMSAAYIFPITDEHGRFVYFQTMAPGRDPKYMGVGKDNVLATNLPFGYKQARGYISRSGQAIFVEGVFDQLLLWQNGIKNTMATLGKPVKPQHLELDLIKECVDVVWLPDGAMSGRNSIYEIVHSRKYKKHNIRVALIPTSQDPDEYIIEYGVDAVLNIIDAAKIPIQYMIDELVERYPADNMTNRYRFLNALKKYFVNISLFQMDLGLQYVSELSDIDIDTLRDFYHADTMSMLKDVGLERRILATLVNNKSTRKYIVSKLHDDDFTDSTIASLFDKISNLIISGAAFGAETYQKFLTQDECTIIATLPGSIDKLDDLEDAIFLLSDLSCRRRIWDSVSDLRAGLADASTPINDTIEGFYTSGIVNNLVIYDSTPSTYASAARLDFIKQLQSDDKIRGYHMSHRWGTINKLWSGINTGYLYYISSNSGVGKSAFMCNLAVDMGIVVNQLPILIISCEMSPTELAGRMVAILTGISGIDIMNGNVDDNNAKIIQKAFGMIHNSNIYIDELSDITMSNIMASIDMHYIKYGVQMVFIDYIQMIRPEARHKGMQKYQLLEDASNELKWRSRKSGQEIAIFALSQQSDEAIDTKAGGMRYNAGAKGMGRAADKFVVLAPKPRIEGIAHGNVIYNIDKDRQGRQKLHIDGIFDNCDFDMPGSLRMGECSNYAFPEFPFNSSD